MVIIYAAELTSFFFSLLISVSRAKDKLKFDFSSTLSLFQEDGLHLKHNPRH